MARRERQPIKEAPPAGAPAWMLTFCDCMTLLLTFFVLLLSFSSFDESTLRRLEGAMNIRAASAPTISLQRNRLDNSVSVEEMPVIDRTDKGAIADQGLCGSVLWQIEPGFDQTVSCKCCKQLLLQIGSSDRQNFKSLAYLLFIAPELFTWGSPSRDFICSYRPAGWPVAWSTRKPGLM